MQSKQYVVLSPQRSSYYNQFNPYIPLLKTSYPLRMAKQSNVIDSSISSTDFSVHSSSNNHSLNSRIENLLCDDHDEEDEEVPDYSEEAAKEIADKSIYSRISESAKWKANMAIKTRPSISMEPIDMKKPSASKRKYKSKMTASVKETGVDTISDYVKSMGQHELLPHESEILLGRQIQILVKWESKRQELEDSLSRPPNFGEWASALNISVPELKKQIRRSQRAKAALIEANLRLVVTVARQGVRQDKSELSFQDAAQEGIIGLSIACDRFDPEKGFRFSTYATWWIRREVLRNVNQQSRTMRLPESAMKRINDIRINERLLMTTLGRKPTDEEVAAKCNLPIEKLWFYRKAAMDITSLDKEMSNKAGKGSSAGGIASNGKTIGSLVKDLAPTPAEIAAKEMLQSDVRKLIKTLSPREQAVVRLRFGLDDGTPRTLEYIAKKFNVDKEKVRRVEAKALLKLRQPYRNQTVKCYISDL
jgi:RNA polymerase primary sigma factor